MKFLVFFLIFFPINAWSQLSLLQDRLGLSCKVIDGEKLNGQKIKEVKMGRRDRVLKLFFEKHKEVMAYRSLEFLDFAVIFSREFLAEASSKKVRGDQKRSGDHIFFHIFENGQIRLLVGSQLEMKESDCKDTGASKKCSNSLVEGLFWSGQKLVLQQKEKKYGGAVTRYGHFPNDGTYFWAEQKTGNSLVLIDYGAQFHLIHGKSFSLNCVYEKNDLE